MRIAWILIGTLFFSTPAREEVLIVREKTVTVRGNTSFGKFNCSLNKVNTCDTLFLGKTHKPYGFILPVKSFGCGNFLLNRDFQNTLKADKHPEIMVEVLSLNQVRNQYHGNLKLKLAGATKMLYNVPFEQQTGKNCHVLRADLQLQFSHFNLEPPKKLGGLIRVEEDLLISVDLEVEKW
jgi:hypothetical protein